ncbi:MAG: hypothetical protein ACYC1D_19675 [Acidimicrobiales bacterium]
MTVVRSVGDVLGDHVTLEVECVDRMYLNLYVPKVVCPAGVVGFFKYHRGMPFVSGTLMDPISKGFVADIQRFVADEGVDLVHFVKGIPNSLPTAKLRCASRRRSSGGDGWRVGVDANN